MQTASPLLSLSSTAPMPQASSATTCSTNKYFIYPYTLVCSSLSSSSPVATAVFFLFFLQNCCRKYAPMTKSIEWALSSFQPFVRCSNRKQAAASNNLHCKIPMPERCGVHAYASMRLTMDYINAFHYFIIRRQWPVPHEH